jgi:putative SOS response-associated peptidase YedK
VHLAYIARMCGRYSADLKWDDVAKLYDLSRQGPLPQWDFQPSYNVCPTDPVPVIVPDFDRRQLVMMRWGLILSWWAKPLKELRLATFNARAETVQEKPFSGRRSSAPAVSSPPRATTNGTTPIPTTKKRSRSPTTSSAGNGQLMTFAGLYDTWHDKAENKTIQSCAMVITAEQIRRDAHDRMPVILEREHFDTWMRTNEVEEAAALMKPAGEDVLQRWPVAKRINSSRTPKEDRSQIDEVELAT